MARDKKSKRAKINKDDLIFLREGIYYDQVKDSYVFDTDDLESLGFFSIGLQVTKRCNAQCIHCAASQQSPELSTEKMLELIEKLYKEGCVKLNFTGGEPLLREDLALLLKKAKSLGMATTLSTNGFALTREKIREIKPYLTNIRFSLHGLEKTNDEVFQKKGAFNRIMKSIGYSHDEGLSVGVMFSAMLKNFQEIDELSKILEKKGVDKLIIFTLMSAGRAQAIFAKEFLHVSELENQLNLIRRNNKNNRKLEITLVDWRIQGQCLLIDPTGILYGYDFSEADSYLWLGNALEESLKELWDKFPYKTNYYKYYQQH